MTENAEPTPAKSASRRRSLIVWASIVVVLVGFLYMEGIPPVLHWPFRILFVVAVGWLAFAIIRKVRATKFEGKKVVFSLVLVAMLYGVLFLVCHVFVKLMSVRDERLAATKTEALTEKTRRVIGKLMAGNHPAMFDKEIGWVPRPSYQWKEYSISEQGLRGTRVYPETPPDPEKRILCVGDSFTFGYEVDDDQTFPYHGEQMLPGTEWPNLGITGTGLTQSLMRYRRDGRKFGGKYVVIGFMTKNSKRTVNCFRPFVSPNDITPFTQPFATYRDGKFRVEPNPYQDISDYEKLLENEKEELARLYEMDYFTWSNQRTSDNPIVRTIGYVWERRNIGRNVNLLLNRKMDPVYGELRPGENPYGSSIFHPESLGFQAIKRLFDLYYEEVVADGREPLIVILPSASDVEDRRDGKPAKHTSLIRHFDEKGYRYFDFLDALEERFGDELDPKSFYVRTHFNGPTNKMVAEEIIKAFRFKDSSPDS